MVLGLRVTVVVFAAILRVEGDARPHLTTTSAFVGLKGHMMHRLAALTDTRETLMQLMTSLEGATQSTIHEEVHPKDMLKGHQTQSSRPTSFSC